MEKLRELRKEKGLTQDQVSENLGITYQAYAHYENGRRKPDPEMLVKLSDFFDITVDELIGHGQRESVPQKAEEQYILQLFNLLNSSRQKMLIGIAEELVGATGMPLPQKLDIEKTN